jgi:hypothetical protein
MFAKEGKLAPDWGVGILSSYFPEPKLDPKKHKKRVKYDRRGTMRYFDETLKSVVFWFSDGTPRGNSQGLFRYKRHCWFIGKDTYLLPYVSQGAAKSIARKNAMEKRKAKKAEKEGKEYTPKTFTIENDFDVAVIYPMDRAETTPVEVLVPVDVVRQTLGVGPCEYILDKEGLSRAFHGGEKKMHFEGATCGNWDGRLNPLLKKWQKEGKISDEDKQKVVWLIEDMGTFITAVNKRFHAYAGFLAGVEKRCAEAGEKSEDAKAFVAAVKKQLDAMKRQTGRLPRYDKDVAKWNKDLAKHMEAAKGADTCPKGLFSVGRVRQIAQAQDTGIATCRRCVNAIRQAVGLALAATGSPETAALAAGVREECRKILRNPHPLECY